MTNDTIVNIYIILINSGIINKKHILLFFLRAIETIIKSKNLFGDGYLFLVNDNFLQAAKESA